MKKATNQPATKADINGLREDFSKEIGRLDSNIVKLDIKIDKKVDELRDDMTQWKDDILTSNDKLAKTTGYYLN